MHVIMQIITSFKCRVLASKNNDKITLQRLLWYNAKKQRKENESTVTPINLQTFSGMVSATPRA